MKKLLILFISVLLFSGVFRTNVFAEENENVLIETETVETPASEEVIEQETEVVDTAVTDTVPEQEETETVIEAEVVETPAETVTEPVTEAEETVETIPSEEVTETADTDSVPVIEEAPTVEETVEEIPTVTEEPVVVKKAVANKATLAKPMMKMAAPSLPELDIQGDEGSYEINGDEIVIKVGNVTISGKANKSVVVANDGVVLTLNNIEIKPIENGPGIKIKAGVNATILLAEGSKNIVEGTGEYAGIEVGYSKDNLATLTIDGDGELTATGGNNAAGIGGSKADIENSSGVYGNIVINGGDITAQGNNGAAGIGSSIKPSSGSSVASYKYVEDEWGSITINDGTINATSVGWGGAGIGGANHTDSGKIIINGGDVTATGHTGIGSGYGSNKPGANNTKGPGYYNADVTITGGTVHAYAYSYDHYIGTDDSGAGIGGGEYSDAKVTITGGTVYAYGGSAKQGSYHHGGAGIGGGYLGHGDIYIGNSENGAGPTVYAYGGGSAAGIGSGGSPNNSSDRGSSARNGETLLDGTTVTITGGDVFAYAGEYGGAGIGGGNGADKVEVNISGGNIEAYGSKSNENDLRGGAAIGSAYNPVNSGDNKKYFVETDTNISITGGNILAIGGWGANAIGSGAENIDPQSVTIDAEKANIEAYADGTKTAIAQKADLLGSNIYQTTFVRPYDMNYSDEGSELTLHIQTAGLSIIDLSNRTGYDEKFYRMPEGYRAFGVDVPEAGEYAVIANASGVPGQDRNYAKSSTADFSEENIISYGAYNPVETGKLPDRDSRYYLFPTKSIIASQRIELSGEATSEDVNTTLYYALSKKNADGSRTFLTDLDGNVQIESISVVNGVAQSKAYFTGLEEGTYDVWEMDENGDPLEIGRVYGTVTLTNIATEHTDVEGNVDQKNNGTIDRTIWSDEVVLINTYHRESSPVVPEPEPAPDPIDPTPDPVDPEDPIVDPEPEIEYPSVEPIVVPDDPSDPPVETSPITTEEISGNEVPLAGFGLEGPAWALVNLICTVVTVMLALIMLLSIKKNKEEEDEENEVQVMESEEEKEEDKNRRRWIKVLGIIPAVIAVIVFILTEDIRLPMIIVDRWTWLMIVILLVNLAVTYLTKYRVKREDEEDENGQQLKTVAATAIISE